MLASASVLVLAGCSSSGTKADQSTAATKTGGAGNSTVSTAAQEVARAKAPVALKLPAQSPPAAKNKTITVITCAASAEGCARMGNAAKDAAKAFGWKVNVVDGKGTPTVQNTAIDQAIAAKVDAIGLIAIDKEAVAEGLARARTAGIPVISTFSDNTQGTGPANVFAEVGYDSRAAGKILAQWVIADSKAKAVIAMFHSPELVSLRDRYNGSHAVFAACSTCKLLPTQKYSLATAATNLPLMTQSLLQSQPTVQYIWTGSGGFGTLQAAAVAQAGKTKVKVVTFDCDPSVLKDIRAGTVEVACAGAGLNEGAWAMVDEMNRAFNNAPAVPAEVQSRLFDKTNLPTSDLWPGDGDYETAYKTLWKV